MDELLQREISVRDELRDRYAGSPVTVEAVRLLVDGTCLYVDFKTSSSVLTWKGFELKERDAGLVCARCEKIWVKRWRCVTQRHVKTLADAKIAWGIKQQKWLWSSTDSAFHLSDRPWCCFRNGQKK